MLDEVAELTLALSLRRSNTKKSSSRSFKFCRNLWWLVRKEQETNCEAFFSVHYAPLGLFFRVCAWSGGTF